MQRDFVEPGGFGESLGNDVGPLRAIVPTVQRLLAAVRRVRMTVVHTREGHAPDLSDCPPSKPLCGAPKLRIGDPGPLGPHPGARRAGPRGRPELAPAAGELVIDKPAEGAFYATELHTMVHENRKFTDGFRYDDVIGQVRGDVGHAFATAARAIRDLCS